MTPKTKPFARTLTALSVCASALWANPSFAERPSFQTPSGNILCYLENGASELDLYCVIFEANWSYQPAVDDCDLDRFRAVQLGRNWPAETLTICASDVFWPYPTPTLGYGSTWSVDGFSCTIQQDGVACTDDEAQGRFHLARRAVQLN